MYSGDLSQGKVKMMRRAALLGVGCVGALLMLTGGTAGAHLIEPYVYSGVYPAGTFNGSDAVGGPAPLQNSVRSVDIDQQTGDVYVGQEASGGLIYKFNSAGQSAPFS